jgi:rhodanese-related sulfurtransferase
MGLVRRLARRLLGGGAATNTGGSREQTPTSSPPPSATSQPESVLQPPLEGANLSNIEAGIQEVKERVDAGEPVVMLDVRNADETAQGVVTGAILIPLPELEARWEELKDCNEIVCYCARGGRSLEAAKLLRQKGLFNATSLEGGVAAWSEMGGKLVAPAG